MRTDEQKYFISAGAEGRPLKQRLRVGFCHWNVEHGLRRSKSELGFRHFEGRSYTGLMQHLTLCLLTLTFVAGQAEGLRGENPEVTAEQVCRGLNGVGAQWLESLRGTEGLPFTSEAALQYQQRRNQAARESRQRRRCGLPLEYEQPAPRGRNSRRRSHRANARSP